MARKTILNDELLNQIIETARAYKVTFDKYPDAYQLMQVHDLKSKDAHSIINQLQGGK